MATGLHSWSQTAATNATADSAINWAEGMAPSAVNDSSRAVMSVLAKYRDDTAGTITTAGTSTAFTATTSTTFASFTELNGQVLFLKMHTTSGATPTLNVSGLGAKNIKSVSGTNIATGYLMSGGIYAFTYSSSNNEFVVHGSPGALSGLATLAVSGAVTTGALTASGLLTVSAGGAAITGNSAVTGTWTTSGALTVSAGGAAITGNSTVTGTLTVSTTLTASSGFTVSAGAVSLPAGSVADAALALPGAIKLIATQSASASATIDFNASNAASAFDGTYDRLVLYVSAAKPATDDVEFWIRIGTGAGPTYQTSGYKWIASLIAPSDGVATQGSASDTNIKIGNTGVNGAVGNAAGENISATIQFDNPSDANFMQVMFDAAYHRAGNEPSRVSGSGHYATAGAVTAIRLMFESGNITSGRFALYGIKKS